jgi:hypothetical protein
MGLLEWIARGEPNANVNIRKLQKRVLADKSTFRQATADTIMALADYPYSEEIFSSSMRPRSGHTLKPQPLRWAGSDTPKQSIG